MTYISLENLCSIWLAICNWHWCVSSCHLLATDTWHCLLLCQFISLDTTVGQMRKDQWLLHGGLTCNICWPCAMYSLSQEILSIRLLVTLLFETSLYIVNISGWLFWLQVPDVLSYVKKKAELHELKQAMRVWSHHKKIQQTTLSSCKRLLHKLTVNSLHTPRCAKHAGLSQYISDGKWTFGNRLVWET